MKTNIGEKRIISGPVSHCLSRVLPIILILFYLLPVVASTAYSRSYCLPGTSSQHLSISSGLHSQPSLCFGFGYQTSTLFSRAVDQIFFPGFSVQGSYLTNDLLLEFRGRFTFGEVDSYQIEAAGYRPVSDRFSNILAGGGIGYGGMNQKEIIIVEVNGILVPGTFYSNGKGSHAFLGAGCWLYKGTAYDIKADLDYYISLFNVKELHTPTGLRLGINVMLHTP
jgi:hypothetical protein